MSQRTLHGRRLTLVPLADEHLEWEVELDPDPAVMRYLSGGASTRDGSSLRPWPSTPARAP